MSHRVTLPARLTNMQTLAQVCVRHCAELTVANEGQSLSTRLYDGPVQGKALVQLPGFNYPVCVQPDGSLVYDTFKGQWGDEALLHRLVQDYAGQEALHAYQEVGLRLESEMQTEADGSLVFAMVH